MEEQRRFLTSYEEVGSVLLASRGAQVSTSEHYRWLEQDATYRARFQAARLKACRHLDDEAQRRATYGAVRMVPYKGKPVGGKRLHESKYSDQLTIKLLEAGDPDRFNREEGPAVDGNLDELTPRQVSGLVEWLDQMVKGGEVEQALNKEGQQARETERPESPEPIRFIPPFHGADGWPYKVMRKKRK